MNLMKKLLTTEYTDNTEQELMNRTQCSIHPVGECIILRTHLFQCIPCYPWFQIGVLG